MCIINFKFHIILIVVDGTKIMVVYFCLQVIEYIYTDLQITERYKHALEVYANLQRSSQSLSNWIRQVFHKYLIL